jgi:hypothetical protein
MKNSHVSRFEDEEAVYRVLNLIFYALVGIPLLFFLFLYLQIKDGRYSSIDPSEDLNMILLFLIPVFCLVNIILAYVTYQRKLKNVIGSDSLQIKLEGFFKASVLKYSFLAAASVITILGLFITAEMLYSIIYLTILLIFSLNRPTPFRLRKDLKIRSFPSEKREENRPDVFL